MQKILKVTMLMLFPLVLFLCVEFLNDISTEALKSTKCIVNFLIISALLTGIFGITGKIRWSMIITAVITMALAIANCILVEMRGTTITPADFYSISMVTKMLDGMKIIIPYKVFISITIIILWIICCINVKIDNIDRNKNKVIRLTSVTFCIAIFSVFFNTNFFKIEHDFNTKVFYRKNGVITSFLSTVKDMKLGEPEGYSREEITKKVNKILGGNSDKKSNKEKPNIIVIMNESLTDLENVYNIKISEDNMPFIHSLKENTIKKNVYSSSLGGKTANCEWEFLTGNTTKFLPLGAVPYQQYLKTHTISIVDSMKDLGYKTSAFHPYNPEGYSRNIVYPLFGFDEYKFNDTMEKLNMIRYGEYADDLSTYKNIIKLFEEKKDDEKIFNFTVTMQNHLSYDDKDFKNTVFLKNKDKEKYYEVNQYLSLVKLSDEAFKYLVKYFEKYDEPTIIMMFGDHQPGFVENYPEIFENSDSKNKDLDERKYIIPMVMWGNYNIEEMENKEISMNYLSTVLFDTANLPKSKYTQFLEKLYAKYPVITANMYKDKKGLVNTNGDLPEEFKLYEYIQYNNMFDKNKINELYEIK